MTKMQSNRFNSLHVKKLSIGDGIDVNIRSGMTIGMKFGHVGLGLTQKNTWILMGGIELSLECAADYAGILRSARDDADFMGFVGGDEKSVIKPKEEQ